MKPSFYGINTNICSKVRPPITVSTCAIILLRRRYWDGRTQ